MHIHSTSPRRCTRTVSPRAKKGGSRRCGDISSFGARRDSVRSACVDAVDAAFCHGEAVAGRSPR